MDFVLPKHLQANATVVTITPPYETGMLMPFANTTNINGIFGNVLLQSYACKEFAVYQHIFRMNQDVRLKVDADQRSS